MNKKQLALLSALFLWLAISFLKVAYKPYTNPEFQSKKQELTGLKERLRLLKEPAPAPDPQYAELFEGMQTKEFDPAKETKSIERRISSLEKAMADIEPEMVQWSFRLWHPSDLSRFVTLTVPAILVGVPLFLWLGYKKKANGSEPHA